MVCAWYVDAKIEFPVTQLPPAKGGRGGGGREGGGLGEKQKWGGGRWGLGAKRRGCERDAGRVGVGCVVFVVMLCLL